jgi:hypothetical protein
MFQYFRALTTHLSLDKARIRLWESIIPTISWGLIHSQKKRRFLIHNSKSGFIVPPIVSSLSMTIGAYYVALCNLFVNHFDSVSLRHKIRNATQFITAYMIEVHDKWRILNPTIGTRLRFLSVDMSTNLGTVLNPPCIPFKFFFWLIALSNIVLAVALVAFALCFALFVLILVRHCSLQCRIRF